MQYNLPTYQQPLQSNTRPYTSVQYWDKAYNAFDNKKYAEAVEHTLNYINTDILKDIEDTSNFEITRTHGSMKVTLVLNDKELSITAPFVDVSNANKVVALRKANELNFTPLNMSNIILKDNKLYFDFRSQIDFCNPNKVYDALTEICRIGDRNDDIFINEYDATFINEPNITKLSSEEEEKVLEQIKQIFTDYDKNSEDFVASNSEDYVWDMIAITLLMLNNMPYIQGAIKDEIDDGIYDLWGNTDFKQRIFEGKKLVEKLKSLSDDDWKKELYHIEMISPLKWRSSVEILQDEMKRFSNTVDDCVRNNNHFYLSYYLYWSLLKVMHDINLEKDHYQMIEKALMDVSNKIVSEETAQRLVSVYKQLLNGEIEQVDTRASEKKGFFAKLFG